MLRLSAIILILLSGALTAQNLKWERVYGSREYEYGRSIVQCIDSGYAVAGTTSGYGPATDMYLVYLNKDGSFRWHKNFGGINDEWAYAVKQTPADSGFILCGFSNTWGGSGYDVYLVKTDKLGNLLWQKTYGGPDWDFGYSVDLTNDGGYVIGGSTYSYGEGGEDAFMVKVDASGNLQWFNVYGGFEDDNVTEIHQSIDGGYIFSGRTKSFGLGDYDMWVVKTGATGDTVWTRTYGSSAFDELTSITPTLDGAYAGIGTTFGNNGDADIYLLKVDLAGTLLTFVNDVDVNQNIWMKNIRQNSDGTYFSSGYRNFVSGSSIMDFAFYHWNAGLFWQNGGNRGGLEDDLAYCGLQTFDKGWVVAGNTKSFGNGKSDLYVVKLDSNFAWTNLPIVGIAPENVNTSLNLSIYPNPASSELFFSIPPGIIKTDAIVTVFDVLGRPVLITEANPLTTDGRQFTIPVSTLAQGSYLLTLSNGTHFFTGRFLVGR